MHNFTRAIALSKKRTSCSCTGIIILGKLLKFSEIGLQIKVNMPVEIKLSTFRKVCWWVLKTVSFDEKQIQIIEGKHIERTILIKVMTSGVFHQPNIKVYSKIIRRDPRTNIRIESYKLKFNYYRIIQLHLYNH